MAKKLKKYQGVIGGSETKKETLKEQNARRLKEIEDREKRISEKDSLKQKNSYSNQRANSVVGNYRKGGSTKSKSKKK